MHGHDEMEANEKTTLQTGRVKNHGGYKMMNPIGILLLPLLGDAIQY